MAKKAILLSPLFLTQQKIQEIKDEIQHINTTLLPEIRTRLATAYEDGDMPENNPWITASIDLQNTMARRNELRRLLLRAKIYSPHKEHDKIHIGSKITIQIEGSKPAEVTLVSSEEALPEEGKISVDSPIGQALLNGKIGQDIFADTPAGTVRITILK
ncbi:MAG: GreA/GreB family elongation factor [Patescibacteria group bacterium]